ncbi:aspartyl-phosphate phosphatase Spo0E family protein [Metabacillus sp. RGM 3146]|uniref:aspartyl-phosphate phosphatase Spo0E family protein n=1 Tax=Metabacillus sp. RGM 3146 TaxID=3401092 RepID=UPI003B9A60F9
MLKQELIEKIEKKRAELIEVVSKKGMSASIAIEHSQELDRLLNEYNYWFLCK